MERLAPIARHLAKIVRRYDTTRPVTLAAAFPELSSRLHYFDALDVVGYNYKEHLYEEDHRRFPSLPILGSENGHGLKEWKAVTENDYISGQFLWTGIDYLGEAHGWPIHGSSAGLLTLAGFPKNRYYRRQSFWLDAPVLHLSTARYTGDATEYLHASDCWNYEDGEQILVRCYTNLPSKYSAARCDPCKSSLRAGAVSAQASGNMCSMAAVIIRHTAVSHKILKADHPVFEIRMHGDPRIQNRRRHAGAVIRINLTLSGMNQFSCTVHDESSPFFLIIMKKIRTCAGIGGLYR